METFLTFITDGSLFVYIAAALSVIGGFRVITTMTPNKTDDKILNSILKFLNLMSAAVGKNKVDLIEEKPKNTLKGSGGFALLPVLLFISIIMIVFLSACAGGPTRMSFTDVTGAERITEDQCIYRVLTPSKCRTVAHTKRDNLGYKLESDTVTESPGVLQGAVQSAVHQSVGLELFDDKGSNVSNDSNSTSKAKANSSAFSGSNKKRHGH